MLSADQMWTEEEARSRCEEPIKKINGQSTFQKWYDRWKGFWRVYTKDEKLNLNSFKEVGIVECDTNVDLKKFEFFTENQVLSCMNWSKNDLIALFQDILPESPHKETGKFLDRDETMQRLFDIIFSISALIMISPLLIISALILRFTGEKKSFIDKNGRNLTAKN